MTILFTNSDFWIELLQVAPSSVGAGAFVISNLALSRGGRYIGSSSTLLVDAVPTITEMRNFSIGISHTDDSALDHGDILNTVRIRRGNSNAGAFDFGTSVIIFMRK